MTNDAYRRRLEKDLETWRAAGWVSADGGAKILESLGPPAARMSAATALGFAGAALLGVALVAFVMANWDGLPRFGRLTLVVALLLAAIGGAIWTDARRPQAQGALLLLATLIFAAGAGLVGQMYNLSGDPAGVYALAAAAGLALAIAGMKAAPAIAGAGFAVFAYVSLDRTGPAHLGVDDLGLLVMMAGIAGLAWVHRAKPLIHVGIWFFAFTLFALLYKLLDGVKDGAAVAALVGVIIWSGAAAWGRMVDRPGARTLYGYGAWFALSAFWVWGYAGDIGIGHRALAIVAALGLLALGRTDRHGWVLAAGVVGLLAGVAAMLADLGLDLMVAAGLFLLLALVALVGAFALGRRRAASGGAT